jgi:hypothetical protein
MNRAKQVAVAVIVAVVWVAATAFSQTKAETAPASVLLRFAKEGTVSKGCSQTLGLITQGMLQVEGVKNVKIDAKNNGVQVSYDPGKTSPQKIMVTL